MKYQAILFDMDGTLVNSEPLHQQAFEETFKQFDIAMTDDDFKSYIVGKTDTNGLKDYLTHINKQLDIPDFNTKKAAAYASLASEHLASYPGIVELVRDLANIVPLALVTNSHRSEADLVLKSLDIDGCFDIIITADGVEKGKPSPEGYLRAMNLLSKQPEDCVIVEDSPTGVTAANEAGIRCIAVTNTHSEGELAHADLVVSEITKDLF